MRKKYIYLFDFSLAVKNRESFFFIWTFKSKSKKEKKNWESEGASQSSNFQECMQLSTKLMNIFWNLYIMLSWVEKIERREKEEEEKIKQAGKLLLLLAWRDPKKRKKTNKSIPVGMSIERASVDLKIIHSCSSFFARSYQNTSNKRRLVPTVLCTYSYLLTYANVWDSGMHPAIQIWMKRPSRQKAKRSALYQAWNATGAGSWLKKMSGADIFRVFSPNQERVRSRSWRGENSSSSIFDPSRIHQSVLRTR